MTTSARSSRRPRADGDGMLGPYARSANRGEGERQDPPRTMLRARVAWFEREEPQEGRDRREESGRRRQDEDVMSTPVDRPCGSQHGGQAKRRTRLALTVLKIRCHALPFADAAPPTTTIRAGHGCGRRRGGRGAVAAVGQHRAAFLDVDVKVYARAGRAIVEGPTCTRRRASLPFTYRHSPRSSSCRSDSPARRPPRSCSPRGSSPMRPSSRSSPGRLVLRSRSSVSSPSAALALEPVFGPSRSVRSTSS